MRLTRRIAIVALSAVMALAMLTACGGGETPSPGGGSGTGTGAGTGGSSDSSTDSGTGSGKDNTTVDPSTLTSRTAKYFARKGVTGKMRYIRYYDEEEDWEWVDACDGRRSYCYCPASSASERFAVVNLYDIKEKATYSYRPDKQEESISKDTGSTIFDSQVNTVSFIPSNLSDFSPVAVEPMTIHNVEYYCERERWSSYTYCFEKTDTEGLNLKYVVKSYSSGLQLIYDIKEVKATFDMDLLRIPAGRHIYTLGEGMDYNLTGKDTYPN